MDERNANVMDTPEFLLYLRALLTTDPTSTNNLITNSLNTMQQNDFSNPTAEQVLDYLERQTGGRPAPNTALLANAMVRNERELQQGLLMAAMGMQKTDSPVILEGLPERLTNSPLYWGLLHTLAVLHWQQSDQSRTIAFEGKNLVAAGGVGVKTLDVEILQDRDTGKDIALKQTIKHPVIIVKMNDLARKVTGYADPDYNTIQRVFSWLMAMAITFPTIRTSNGAVKAPILHIHSIRWLNKPADYVGTHPAGSVITLALHPVFTDFTWGFERFPTNVIERLRKAVNGKLTNGHFVLMNRLSLCDKNKPKTLLIDTDLYNSIGMAKAIERRHIEEAETRLIAILDALKAIGQIIDYTTETRQINRGRIVLSKATIRLNPNFGKPQQLQPKPKAQA